MRWQTDLEVEGCARRAPGGWYTLFLYTLTLNTLCGCHQEATTSNRRHSYVAGEV